MEKRLSDKKVSETSKLLKLSSHYSENYSLRAAIQLIPHIGSSLDTLFAGAGTNWQFKRLEAFIRDLHEKLEKINQALPEFEPDENLFDFVVQVFNEVIRHRSEEKRKRFANIFVRQIVERLPWDEAETAARFLAELTEQHVEILHAIVTAPEYSGGRFQGVRIVTIVDWDGDVGKQSPPDLRKMFPKLVNLALRMYLSELLAKGLIYDEGADGLATKTFEVFRPTELGDWFIKWVRDSVDINE